MVTIAETMRAAYPSLRVLTEGGLSVTIGDSGVDVQVSPFARNDRERQDLLLRVLTLLPPVGWIIDLQEWPPSNLSSSAGAMQAKGVIDGVRWKVWTALEALDQEPFDVRLGL